MTLEQDGVRQDIWDDWYDESGPCDGCPAHDPRYTPSYGGSSETPEEEFGVMLVLSDPNDERESDEGPESEFEKPSEWTYGYDADNGWRSMKYYNGIAERITGCEDANDVYSTNALKCPTHHDDGFNGGDERDRQALDHCVEHLDREVRVIQPKVVIALSNPAIDAVASIPSTEFNDPLTGAKSYVREWMEDGRRSYGEDPAVIAGVHPSPGRLHLNVQAEWYGEEDHHTWYYSQVAESANQVLQS